MRIELSPEQERWLLEWAAENAQSEALADCEPSGYSLRVEVGAAYVHVEAHCGNRVLALGDARIEWRSGYPAAATESTLETACNAVRGTGSEA